MPIYEYRCTACGHKDDHLQKVTEAPLTKCPACGKRKYQKQLSAAGFQLKGSGWYVTDFRGGKQAETKAETKGESAPEGKSEAKAEAKPEKKGEAKAEAKPAKTTPASTTN